MLNEAQLAQAVEKNIITDEQRNKLLELIGASAHDERLVAFDEAPRFFRSFNDLFIGLGVGILAFAVGYMETLLPLSKGQAGVVAPLIGIVVFWLMAEWLTRVRRINFPSIIIAIAFTYFTARACIGAWEYFFEIEPDINTITFLQILGAVTVTSVTSLALLAFFARFRLPFSLLLLAGAICLADYAILVLIFGTEPLEPFIRWIVMVQGLIVFAAAMWFDFQDPLREKRTSDHAFWLHLIAAPIITHSVLWNSLQPLMSNDNDVATTGNLLAALVLSMFLVFSLIALIIDRRALLISSLGYASTALGYIIYKFDLEANTAIVLTLLLIALLVLSLGTGWHSLRKGLFGFLPNLALFRKLPPVDV